MVTWAINKNRTRWGWGDKEKKMRYDRLGLFEEGICKLKQEASHVKFWEQNVLGR